MSGCASLVRREQLAVCGELGTMCSCLAWTRAARGPNGGNQLLKHGGRANRGSHVPQTRRQTISSFRTRRPKKPETMRVIPARQDGIRGGRGWFGGPRCPCLLIGLACSGQPCQLATCPVHICSGATVRLSTDAGKAQSQAMTSRRPQGARHFGRLTTQPQPGRPGVLDVGLLQRAAQPWSREMAAARGGLCMTARGVVGVACARRIAIFPDVAGQSEGINRDARTLCRRGAKKRLRTSPHRGHSQPALGDRTAPAWPAWAENDEAGGSWRASAGHTLRRIDMASRRLGWRRRTMNGPQDRWSGPCPCGSIKWGG